VHNLAFSDKLYQILKVLQCFGKHCSYYLQGESLGGEGWEAGMLLYRSGSEKLNE
jgi:hypothetical protein